MQRGRGREDARRGARITSGRGGATGIVAAGGRGERASGPGEPLKQFRLLAGRPLIRWSVDMLFSTGCSCVVVVTAPGSIDRTSSILQVDGIRVVEGGQTRRASVRNGLRLVESPEVIVHDAARPLARPELAVRALEALDRADGAVVAVPVADTLKRIEDDKIVETIDRSALYRAQTPQAFRTERLVAAHERAEREGFEPTDDAQLLERYGGTVVVVPGSETNIKITYPQDFAAAEALMGRR